MRAAASKLQLCKHYRLKSEHKTATFRKFGRSADRKRGPKDGWNGLTLKILRYIVERGVVTRREIERAFGLTQNAVLYHLRKLREWGLVLKVGRGPVTVYVFNHKLCGGLANWECLTLRTNGSSAGKASNILVEGLRRICRLADSGSNRDRVSFRSLVKVWLALCFYREYGKAANTHELSSRLGYSVRHVQKCLARLVESGLVVPTGGRRCRFVSYIPAHLPRGVVHTHKYARCHRYRCKSFPEPSGRI